jgi:hypothetical protein
MDTASDLADDFIGIHEPKNLPMQKAVKPGK